MGGAWAFGAGVRVFSGALLGLFGWLAGCSLEASDAAQAKGTVEVQSEEDSSAWQAFEGGGDWDGLAIRVQLRPLMPNLARAERDARAWKLEPGQIVWSLSLSLGEPGSDPAGGEAAAQDLQPHSIAGMRVEYANGKVLLHQDSAEVLGLSGVYDPLQVLLASSGSELTPGSSVSIPLIGPAVLEAPKWVHPSGELKLSPIAGPTHPSPSDIPILNYAASISR
jgi:hypothetical protein